MTGITGKKARFNMVLPKHTLSFKSKVRQAGRLAASPRLVCVCLCVFVCVCAAVLGSFLVRVAELAFVWKVCMLLQGEKCSSATFR